MRMTDMRISTNKAEAVNKQKKVNWTRKIYTIIPNRKTTIGRKMRA